MARPHGTKNIKTPEELWDHFCNYVLHEKNNPLFKREYVGKDGKEVDTALQVPVTFEGFECWLADQGIIQDLGDYSKDDNERYSDYAPIITRIRNNCFVQNFKGAAVGLFNPSLIANKLGISSKQEIKHQASVSILNLDPLDSTNDGK